MRYIAYLIVLFGFIGSANAGSYEQFFRAVVRNDAAAVIELIDRGFDANARDESGQPAIIRALRTESDDVALALAKDARLDPNVRNSANETALMWAAMRGHVPVCEVLIARGAAVDRPGWTPLHYAASGNQLAVARLLLSSGAAVDARSPNGRTPLMQAARYGNEELVELLLRNGADRSATDRDGGTAADAARASGREWLADKLQPR
ncbi:ankyrin repeat domain-containing protein [Caldimonas sp. KR1-144]|uniref:ankyrin repeat domain-containing protein n=1 Tax=Caldimonas sp. KR1-144 TaxID=3400911 RepID=UPI003C0ACE04